MDLLNGIEKGIYNLFAESDFIPKGVPMGMPPMGMPQMPFYWEDCLIDQVTDWLSL